MTHIRIEPVPFPFPYHAVGCIMFLRLANRRVSHDDLTVQIAITVGTAYLSFYVAQYVLGKNND